MPNDDRAHLRHILNSDGTVGYTAIDREYLKALQAENAQLRAENERLRHDVEKLGLNVGPHSDPADCPTYYDHCHCTVETLIYNIDRADRAEDENKQLLEACEMLVQAQRASITSCQALGKATEMAHAAIAKAKGG